MFTKTSVSYTSKCGHTIKVGDMVKWHWGDLDESCSIVTSIHKVKYKRNWRIRIQAIRDGHMQDMDASCFHNTYEKVS